MQRNDFSKITQVVMQRNDFSKITQVVLQHDLSPNTKTKRRYGNGYMH